MRHSFPSEKNPVKPSSQNLPPPDSAAPRRRELQTQQARTFKSVNALAAGIAHDFSNAVAGLLGSAEALKMDAPPATPANPNLDRIFTTGMRLRHMIQQLRNFCQRQPGNRTLLLLPPVIKASVKFIRPRLPATVKLGCRLETKCPAILADAAQLQQVVTSLCTNAAQALAGQTGRIEVRLETCAVDADLAAANPGLPTGRQVRLSIRDNGPHFHTGMLPRIFEPFACKLTNGYNSGLELFAVREIVHAHEGTITVDSAPGAGTVFKIYFPIPANDDAEAAASK